MFSARLKIFTHFKVSELFRLVAGKLVSSLRDNRFGFLQEKEIKLALVFAYDKHPVLADGRVRFRYLLQQKTLTLDLRMQGSDVFVFQQILVHQAYRDVVNAYADHFGTTPQSIVDAGANVGLSSIFFALHYPQAKILAIEPDEDNARVARINLSLNSINSVELRAAALWPVPGKLAITNDFRDGSNWSLRVEESQQGSVEALTPSDVVNYFDGPIDIFKMDIEGGEARLFENNASAAWLDRIKIIAIEIHPEAIDPSLIIKTLRDLKFEVQVSGELTIGINSSLLH